MDPSDELSGVTISGLRTLNQDPRITAMLRERLDQIVPLREGFDRLRRDGPSADSEAARDGLTEVGRMALEFARLQWISGSDHLVTWALVVSAGKQPWHGHASLLRQGMEGAVTARWLLEPGIDASQRRQRGAAIQRRDYDDRLEWERATGTADRAITGRKKSATERLAELDALITAEGVPKQPPALGPTKLFELYWVNDPRAAWPKNGRALYQALSSISHNRQWSIQFTERTRMGPASAGVTGSQDVLVTASGPLAVMVTGCVVATLRTALEELEQYCGLAPSR